MKKMDDYNFQAQLGMDGQFGKVIFVPAKGVMPEQIPVLLNLGLAFLDEANAEIFLNSDGSIVADILDTCECGPTVSEWGGKKPPRWDLHPDDWRYLALVR